MGIKNLRVLAGTSYLVDFIRSLGHKVLDTIPGPAFTGDVKQGPFLLPRKPVVLALLSQELQNVHLEMKQDG